MQPNSIFKKIRRSLKNSSVEIWLGVTVITSLVLLIIANGQNIGVNLKGIIFDFCSFLWGLNGLPLLFKDELKLGPFLLKGKIIPIFGVLLLFYYWMSIILYRLF